MTVPLRLKLHFECFLWLVRALEQKFLAETCGRIFQTCRCIFKHAAAWWDYYHTFHFHCNLASTLSFLMISTLVDINHLLYFYISAFQFFSKQLRMCVLNITIWREVSEISTYKIIFCKVSDLFFTSIHFSIESITKYPD